MTITISYRDYANRMNKCFQRLSYNADTKMITIDLSTGGVDFDGCYAILAMSDEELLSLARSNDPNATINDAKAAVEGTIEQMVVAYHEDGYKAVTAEAIKAAAEYIK